MYACHRKEKHGFMCLSVESEGGGCELCFLSARQQKTTELILFDLREEVQHGWWCGYLEMAKNRALTLVEGAPSGHRLVGGCCSVLPPGQMAACLRLRLSKVSSC